MKTCALRGLGLLLIATGCSAEGAQLAHEEAIGAESDALYAEPVCTGATPAADCDFVPKKVPYGNNSWYSAALELSAGPLNAAATQKVSELLVGSKRAFPMFVEQVRSGALVQVAVSNPAIQLGAVSPSQLSPYEHRSITVNATGGIVGHSTFPKAAPSWVTIGSASVDVAVALTKKSAGMTVAKGSEREEVKLRITGPVQARIYTLSRYGSGGGGLLSESVQLEFRVPSMKLDSGLSTPSNFTASVLSLPPAANQAELSAAVSLASLGGSLDPNVLALGLQGHYDLCDLPLGLASCDGDADKSQLQTELGIPTEKISTYLPSSSTETWRIAVTKDRVVVARGATPPANAFDSANLALSAKEAAAGGFALNVSPARLKAGLAQYIKTRPEVDALPSGAMTSPLVESLESYSSIVDAWCNPDFYLNKFDGPEDLSLQSSGLTLTMVDIPAQTASCHATALAEQVDLDFTTKNVGSNKGGLRLEVLSPVLSPSGKYADFDVVAHPYINWEFNLHTSGAIVPWYHDELHDALNDSIHAFQSEFEGTADEAAATIEAELADYYTELQGSLGAVTSSLFPAPLNGFIRSRHVAFGQDGLAYTGQLQHEAVQPSSVATRVPYLSSTRVAISASELPIPAAGGVCSGCFQEISSYKLNATAAMPYAASQTQMLVAGVSTSVALSSAKVDGLAVTLPTVLAANGKTHTLSAVVRVGYAVSRSSRPFYVDYNVSQTFSLPQMMVTGTPGRMLVELPELSRPFLGPWDTRIIFPSGAGITNPVAIRADRGATVLINERGIGRTAAELKINGTRAAFARVGRDAVAVAVTPALLSALQNPGRLSMTLRDSTGVSRLRIAPIVGQGILDGMLR